MAKVMQIQAFSCHIGCNQHTNRRLAATEVLNDFLLIFISHTARDFDNLFAAHLQIFA